MNTSNGYLVLSGLIALAGTALALAARRSPASASALAHGSALLSAILALLTALSVLLGGELVDVTLQVPTPLPGVAWHLQMGNAGAFFLLLIALGAMAASLYGFGYGREYVAHGNAPALGALLNVFLLSLYGVVAAGNAFVFLFFWEAMSLASFFLVILPNEDREGRRAGFLYITMAHIGTGFILAAFLVLGLHAGSLEFSAWREAAASLPAGAASLAFFLAFLGFGAKAGMVPLHIWLPAAHPAAPSPISALMSGVMLKTAVFGLLQVSLTFTATPEPWWGLLFLGAGAVTALVGVIYATIESDVKRLLAYSSVENVGIILLGVGCALVFAAYHQPAGAALGLTAALFHSLNHALIKGLLFLGAGAVVQAVHTRELERMGGLIRSMPVTAACFLVGSLAIAGLPPFNGFVSEWLTFQGLLFLGSRIPDTTIDLVAPLAGAALALASAIAAASFVKVMGTGFLALPRSAEAAGAREAPRSMLAAMVILAALCLTLGLVPGLGLAVIRPAVGALLGTGVALPPAWPAVVSAPLGSASPAGLLLLVAALGLGLYWAGRYLARGRGRTDRAAPTWGCGVELTPRTEYTATAFANPFRIVFRQLLQPRRQVEADYEVAPYFACSLRYRGAITPIFETYLYRPVTQTLLATARRARGIQAGSVQLYLGYMLATLIILLFWAS